MVNNQLCVVIPVHSPNMSTNDIISLKACYKNLSQINCYLVFPEGMDVSKYLFIHPDLIMQPINPIWLSSIENYNKMKINLEFYNYFKHYEFMMTYELDAYIFTSNFNCVNLFSFDYIGAPFFEGYSTPLPNAPFIKGGNSGFSIRNIKSCIQVLTSMYRYRYYWQFYNRFLLNAPKFRSRLNRITKFKFDVYISGRLGCYFSDHHENEDIFWTYIVPFLFPKFKVADPYNALKFSFEINPEKLLILNNGKLPIGCHAWPKNLSFWKDYIQI